MKQGGYEGGGRENVSEEERVRNKDGERTEREETVQPSKNRHDGNIQEEK